MDEKSKKIIVREIEESKDILENLIDGLVRQLAYVGEKLHSSLKELDEINEVLEDLEDEKKECCGCE